MDDDRYWFAPRRFGFGTGWPIAWQGWAISIALIAVLLLAFKLFGKDDARALVIVIPAILAYLIIAAKTTKGGLRWHWGDDQ